MKPHTIIHRLLPGLLLIPLSLGAQCSSSSGATNKGSITPSTSWQSKTSVGPGQYWTFTADPCYTYIFSFCSSDGGSCSWDSELSVNTSTGSTITSAYNNDYCSTAARLSWTPSGSGSYRIYVTKHSCSKTGPGGATLVYKMTPSSTTTPEFILTGSAATEGTGCIYLTSSGLSQMGSAWDANSMLDLDNAFSYDFTINCGTNDANGADGMAFIMQNDPRGLCAVGISGSQIGAGGITNSVAIEIDTYLNTEDRDDGLSGVACVGGDGPDHLDVWLNGNINPAGTSCPGSPGARIIPAAIPLMNGSVEYNIENGLDHIFRVSWVPGSPNGTVTATVLDALGTVSYGTVSYSFNPLSVLGTTTPFFGFTASTGAYVNTYSFCNPAILLPVVLSGFSFDCTQDGGHLDWTTDSEENTYAFGIERSEDGSQFLEVARLDAAGSSAGTHHYQWTDPAYPGPCYYRLAIYGQDGDMQYSQMLSASCMNMLPADFNFHLDGDLLHIYAQNASGRTFTPDIRVLNAMGQVFISEQENMLPGYNVWQLDVHALPPGIYYITVNGIHGAAGKICIAR